MTAPWRLVIGVVLVALLTSSCATADMGTTAPAGHGSSTGTHSRCIGDPGLLWTHQADASDLFQLACDGTANALTETPDGEGGSEAPRWGRCGTVYFDSDRNGSIHAFRLSTRTGVVDQVTVTRGAEMAPAPTPDGRHLVLEHAAADGSGDGLFVVPNRLGVHRKDMRRLTLNPRASSGGFDSGPDVSPDGRTVVFMRLLDGTSGSARSAVFTIGIDGRGLTRLTPYSTNAYQPRWSPDGRRIAFSDNADNFSNTISANVYVMDRDGSHLRRVTSSRAGSHSFAPAWGPGGRSLVYVEVVAGSPGTRLVSRDLSSGDVRVLYQGSEGVENSPDWKACPAG